MSTLLRENLSLLIKQAKLNASALSKLTGIGQPVMSRLLTGETTNPKIDTLRPLARCLQVTLDQLVEGNSPTEPIGFQGLPLLDWRQFSPDLTLSQLIKFCKKLSINQPLSKKAFALKVKDDSMAPKFPKSTLLCVDSDLALVNRAYVIIQPANSTEALFRQCMIDGSNVKFKPLNSEYPIIQLNDNTTYRHWGNVFEARMCLKP